MSDLMFMVYFCVGFIQMNKINKSGNTIGRIAALQNYE
jgi:hypothetical protein